MVGRVVYQLEIDCQRTLPGKKKHNTTIYDIANRVGVSPSTVSRVLSGASHSVSAQVRDRVQKAAWEMNYIPNAQARYLKTRNNPSIGILVPSIENPFYPSIVCGAAEVAAERGYFIYLISCNRDYVRIDQQVQSLLELNVKGIISVYQDTLTPSLENFVVRGGKLVSLSGYSFYFDGAYNLRTDKTEEAKIAMRHLLGLGHRKIAIFMDEMNCNVRFEKVEGYRQTLQEAGIPVREDYIYVYGTDCGERDSFDWKDVEEGDTFVERLLERTPEVTAILCMNDIIALGVCAALRSRGYRVPEDYSVMGFDNAFFSNYCNPTITTVALERCKWGRALMKYLLDIIESPDPPAPSDAAPDTLLPPVYLIERESTGAPRE